MTVGAIVVLSCWISVILFLIPSMWSRRVLKFYVLGGVVGCLVVSLRMWMMRKVKRGG